MVKNLPAQLSNQTTAVYLKQGCCCFIIYKTQFLNYKMCILFKTYNILVTEKLLNKYMFYFFLFFFFTMYKVYRSTERKQVICLQHQTSFLNRKFDNKHGFQMIMDIWNKIYLFLLKAVFYLLPLDENSQITTRNSSS